MNIVGKISLPQRKATLSTATVIRLAGLAAVAAGLCFIVVGLFHPVNEPAAVTTATWANVHIFATVMGLLGMAGMTGLYARQAKQIGWLGISGPATVSTVWMPAEIGSAVKQPFWARPIEVERQATIHGRILEGFMG